MWSKFSKENGADGLIENPERRSFISGALTFFSTLFGALFFFPIAKFLKQPAVSGGNVNRVVAGKVAEIPNDTGRIFRFGNTPALLIKTPDGEFRSFSAVCSHLDCTVQYMDGKQHILCACHNGKFDLSGKVISGPPPRPLEEYRVQVEGEDVIVSRS